jgi:hypothetical protein
MQNMATYDTQIILVYKSYVEHWILIKSTMNALNTLFQPFMAKEESPQHRRPSIFSVQSKTQAALENEFRIIVGVVHEFANVAEDKVDEFVRAGTETPAAIEESIDDFINTISPPQAT